MFVFTDASVECTISPTTCENSLPALFLCLFLLMQAWNAPSAQQPVETVTLHCFYVCSY
jgi:hypothetical protein